MHFLSDERCGKTSLEACRNLILSHSELEVEPTEADKSGYAKRTWIQHANRKLVRCIRKREIEESVSWHRRQTCQCQTSLLQNCGLRAHEVEQRIRDRNFAHS